MNNEMMIRRYQSGITKNTRKAAEKIIQLEQENKQLKEKIKSAEEFCDRYMSVNLELFDMYELLNKIREILGGKENE